MWLTTEKTENREKTKVWLYWVCSKLVLHIARKQFLRNISVSVKSRFILCSFFNENGWWVLKASADIQKRHTEHNQTLPNLKADEVNIKSCPVWRAYFKHAYPATVFFIIWKILNLIIITFKYAFLWRLSLHTFKCYCTTYWTEIWSLIILSSLVCRAWR